MSASKTKKNEEIVSAAPNNLRLENCENTFGPTEIPSANPVNTEPKSTPYAASPACRSPTKVLAKPITAPAAKKAPSIPKISPRIIFEPLTNLNPSNNDFPIFSFTEALLDAPRGISLNP